MPDKSNEQRPARILVIDDEVTQRILVKEYLEEAGYVVRLSDDGRRGLKMAANTKPDLILLDLMLPSMDGYTLCTCLKQNETTAHIPIILITASREPGVIERGLAAGADDFVTKPVDWTFLADRVKMGLARQQKVHAEQAAAISSTSVSDSLCEDKAAKLISGAQAETEKVRESLRAELEAVRCQHEAELQSVKAAAKANLAAAEERHAERVGSFRLQATKEVEAIRNAARAEITRAEQRHAEQLHAMRGQVEALVKEAASGREGGLNDENARLAQEVADLKAALERQAHELAASYEQRLTDAGQRLAGAEAEVVRLAALEANYKSDLRAQVDATAHERQTLQARFDAEREALVLEQAKELEAARRDATAAQAALTADPDQIEALEAEHAERVRSIWDLVRAALVSYIDELSVIADTCKGGVSSGDEAGALGRAGRQSRELANTMGKLRMLAQVMSGRADLRDTIFDLGKLAGDSVAAVKASADEQKVSLALDLPEQPVVVRADHARLSYAIVSLIVNALRFTPQGGRVGVSLKLDDDGAARLEVSDTGVGIAPVLLDSLNACLERPGDVLTGSGNEIGLGLPIAAALIRQHGGSMEIDSGLGRGTRVALVLQRGRKASSAGVQVRARRHAG